MKKITFTILFSILITLVVNAQESKFNTGSNLAFIPNQGQVITNNGQPASMVHYKAGVRGLEFYITDEGLSYVFVKHNKDTFDPAFGGEPDPDFEETTDFARADMVLVGANINKANTINEHPTSSKYNYYYAHCPDGILGVSGYHKITYTNVYPNIDWIIYSTNQELKHEFIVHPGGNPSDIKLKYKWADLIVQNDNIKISTPMGTINEGELYTYIKETGTSVPSSFVKNGNEISINTTAPANQTLVIDPVLAWSTYWGGSGSEQCQSTVASGSKLFIGGYTSSTSYPTTNPGGGAYFQGTVAGSTDAFTASFDTSGVHFWSTYYGGTGAEGAATYTGLTIAVGQGTDFWMLGTTSSTNLPLQDAGGSAYYQSANAGGNDFFIVKFDLNGVRQHATYFGGSSTDGGTSHGNGIDCDANGNVYWAGRSISTNLPLLDMGGGAYYDNSQNGGDDLVIVKMSSSGELLWCTILGGTGDDMNYSMDVHVDRTNSKLYIGTCTSSTNIPTLNPGGGAYYDGTQNGSGDAYFSQFSLAGVMQWATFVGGSGNEWLSMSLGTAPDGDLGMMTLTGSTNMPLVNPGLGAFHDPTHNGGSWDMFITRFEQDRSMGWSSYYGSSNNDHCQHNLTFDYGGNIIMCGVSDGTVAPVTLDAGAPHYYKGVKDASGTYCLVKYDPGGVMLWGAFWGGSGHDHILGAVGGAIGIAPNSDIFISAETNSTDLPMLDPGGGAYFQGTAGGSQDGFIVKFHNHVNIPLSLNLVKFTGVAKEEGNLLDWKLISSSNIENFIVEREEDNAFEYYATVNTNSLDKFSILDNKPLKGTNRYRLQMFSDKGQFVYSNIVELNKLTQLTKQQRPVSENEWSHWLSE